MTPPKPVDAMGILARMRAKQGRRPPAQPDVHPAPGVDLLRDSAGRDVAVLQAGTAAWRRERWMGRVLSPGLRRSWPPVARFSPAQRKVYERIVSTPASVTLYGPTGGGKTMVAMEAARHLWSVEGLSVLAIAWAEFKRLLEPRRLDSNGDLEDDVLRRFAAPRIVLFDDLGYGDLDHQPTAHEKRIFLEIAQLRDTGRHWTWITTNLYPRARRDDGHLDDYGAAALSRLQQGAHVCELDLPDRRWGEPKP